MTPTTGGSDAARLGTAEDLAQDEAALEVLNMHAMGLRPTPIAKSMRDDGYKPPPGRSWTPKTVRELIKAWEHIDVATVPGGLFYRDPNAAPPRLEPDLPFGPDDELPSRSFRRI